MCSWCGAHRARPLLSFGAGRLFGTRPASTAPYAASYGHLIMGPGSPARSRKSVAPWVVCTHLPPLILIFWMYAWTESPRAAKLARREPARACSPNCKVRPVGPDEPLVPRVRAPLSLRTLIEETRSRGCRLRWNECVGLFERRRPEAIGSADFASGTAPRPLRKAPIISRAYNATRPRCRGDVLVLGHGRR